LADLSEVAVLLAARQLKLVPATAPLLRELKDPAWSNILAKWDAVEPLALHIEAKETA
jgi:hypothetical protein